MQLLTTRDVELLERACQYDTRALAEIYDRYSEQIYRYLCRYLGDATQAEDLTGEVFLKLLQVLNTRRAPRERLGGWLYRVAHNLAMDCFRHQGQAGMVPLEESWVAGGDPPSEVVEKRQIRQQVRAAITQLTADQQQVVLLRFGEGMPIARVATLLDKSEGAVKVLQHRAIRRLRKLLDRQLR
jgi:RNA polymerase sigma-70 factor (ECF subfamily)